MSTADERVKHFQEFDVILVNGLPGSGKTHFAHTFFNQPERKRLNRGSIRKMLYEMSTFGEVWSQGQFEQVDEYLVKFVESRIFEHYLQMGKKLVIDNTSVTRVSRQHYLEMARRLHKTLGVIFIDTPVNRCLERNRQRPAEERVPEQVISKLFTSLQLPHPDEGHAEVLIVKDY